MTTKTEPTAASGLDRAKLAIAFTLAAAAMAGFYYYAAEVPLLYRVLGLLGAAAVASLIALQTEAGRQFAGFIKDAQIEARKVVWPTRQEAMQTTLLILVVVGITGVGLWVLDWVLNAIIESIIGS
jgi:preprotein translocase subunit SecE